jgi:hypothetical protein
MRQITSSTSCVLIVQAASARADNASGNAESKRVLAFRPEHSIDHRDGRDHKRYCVHPARLGIDKPEAPDGLRLPKGQAVDRRYLPT